MGTSLDIKGKEEVIQGKAHHTKRKHLLDGDMQDEPYQSRLRELQEAFVQAEENLRICEGNASISN